MVGQSKLFTLGLVSVSLALLFMVPTPTNPISLFIPDTSNSVYGQLGLNPAPTSEEVISTYIVRIPPGAALQDSPIHYYPDNIAIPSGITVAWFNDDPGQLHTVTSGLPESPESGAIFNSGIIPYTSFFQHTFDSQFENHEILYHCEIHPWRTGKVSVSGPLNKDTTSCLLLEPAKYST